MKRKTNSSSRRPAFPILLGIVGLLLWVVSPLDAQPNSDAERRTNLEGMIRLIDAGEVLFAEDGGDLAPFYPDEIPTSELARARIATRVVREHLKAEIDALDAAGSQNPTSLIPESRPHREPPPVDWGVEAPTLEERCAWVRDRLAKFRAEEAESKEEITRGKDRLRQIDEAAWNDLQGLVSGLQLASQVPFAKIPSDLPSLLERENVAELENVLLTVGPSCKQGMIEIAKPDWAFACPVVDRFSSALSESHRRREERRRLNLDVINANERKLRELAEGMQADERNLILRECPEKLGRYRVEWSPDMHHEAYLGMESHLAFIDMECSTRASCRVTAYVDAPFSGRCGLEGELAGDRIRLHPRGTFSCRPDDNSQEKGWQIEGTFSVDRRTASGSAVYDNGRGTKKSGSWTATQVWP